MLNLMELVPDNAVPFRQVRAGLQQMQLLALKARLHRLAQLKAELERERETEPELYASRKEYMLALERKYAAALDMTERATFPFSLN